MYAILRTQKLKTPGNIGGLKAHLNRTMNVPNADPELRPFNSRPVGSADLVADVQNRIQEAGITKVRKDGVLAVEHLMTASPEYFSFEKRHNAQTGKVELWGQQERWKQFEANCRAWLTERYGEKNLVNFTVHKDEQTPHIHAVVVPIDGKGKLNCKSFLGGREKMRAMQDSFAQVHQAQGLQRGIEGSKAHHQEVKRFYGQVQQASQYLVPSVELLPAKTDLEPPQTEGILNRLSFDAQTYQQQEQQRLAEQNRIIHQQNQQRVQYSLSELSKQAQGYVRVSNENRRLKEQLKGLQQQVGKLQGIVKSGRTLLEAVALGSVQPSELKLAKEQLPQKNDKRQEQIYQTMKQIGCEVKSTGKKFGLDRDSDMGIGR